MSDINNGSLTEIQSYINRRQRKASISNHYLADKLQTLQFDSELKLKPSTTKSIEEIMLLKKQVQDTAFFKEVLQNYGEKIYKLCIQYMFFEEYQSGETIFNIGSPGQNFYVILKGTISIFVPRYENIDDTNQIVLKMTEIKVLTAGQSFGEMALINKKPRSATLVCKQDCLLSVLSRESYTKILKQYEEKKVTQQINFLHKLNALNQWGINGLRQLYLNSESKEFTFRQYVYKENDASENVYIIKNGEFLLCKDLILEKQTHQQSQLNQELLKLFKKNSNQKIKKAEIAVLTEGELFGEAELFSKENRQFSVVCASTSSSILKIHKKDYLYLVQREAGLLKLLKQQIKVKQKLYQERIQKFKENTQLTEQEKTQQEQPLYTKSKEEVFIGRENNEQALVNKKMALLKLQGRNQPSSINQGKSNHIRNNSYGDQQQITLKKDISQTRVKINSTVLDNTEFNEQPHNQEQSKIIQFPDKTYNLTRFNKYIHQSQFIHNQKQLSSVIDKHKTINQINNKNAVQSLSTTTQNFNLSIISYESDEQEQQIQQNNSTNLLKKLNTIIKLKLSNSQIKQKLAEKILESRFDGNSKWLIKLKQQNATKSTNSGLNLNKILQRREDSIKIQQAPLKYLEPNKQVKYPQRRRITTSIKILQDPQSNQSLHSLLPLKFNSSIDQTTLNLTDRLLITNDHTHDNQTFSNQNTQRDNTLLKNQKQSQTLLFHNKIKYSNLHPK